MLIINKKQFPFLASEDGYEEIVEFLVKKTSNIDVTDMYGCTALHLGITYIYSMIKISLILLFV